MDHPLSFWIFCRLVGAPPHSRHIVLRQGGMQRVPETCAVPLATRHISTVSRRPANLDLDWAQGPPRPHGRFPDSPPSWARRNITRVPSCLGDTTGDPELGQSGGFRLAKFSRLPRIWGVRQHPWNLRRDLGLGALSSYPRPFFCPDHGFSPTVPYEWVNFGWILAGYRSI